MLESDALYFTSCLAATIVTFFIFSLFLTLIFDASGVPRRELTGSQIPDYIRRSCLCFMLILAIFLGFILADWISFSFHLRWNSGRYRNFGMASGIGIGGFGMFYNLYKVVERWKRNL